MADPVERAKAIMEEMREVAGDDAVLTYAGICCNGCGEIMSVGTLGVDAPELTFEELEAALSGWHLGEHGQASDFCPACMS